MHEISSLLFFASASLISCFAAARGSSTFFTQSTASSFDITFQTPSLAKIRNSLSSSTSPTHTSGSELMCSFNLLSPNALDIAKHPSTRGHSPVHAPRSILITFKKVAFFVIVDTWE
ncbi:hypothetical protein Hanom_Chr06g00540941 [Helianthus anomalus]